jgi:hypothetical protein
MPRTGLLGWLDAIQECSDRRHGRAKTTRRRVRCMRRVPAVSPGCALAGAQSFCRQAVTNKVRTSIEMDRSARDSAAGVCAAAGRG